MTTHVNGPRPALTRSLEDLMRRQRWALVGVPLALLTGLLVVTGVVAASTVLYAAAFGGMMVMHLGGHGSHGGHGQAHEGHASGPTSTPAQDDPPPAADPGGEPETRTAHAADGGHTAAAPASAPERDSHSCH